MQPALTKSSKHHEQAFTLVELMIVVAIFGALASIAIPFFQGASARAKQAEAVSNLSTIYSLEMSYYVENDTFCSGAVSSKIACIGFQTSSNARYLYGAIDAGTDFEAVAQAKSSDNIRPGCGQLDTWFTCGGKDLWTTVDCSSPSNVITGQNAPAGF